MNGWSELSDLIDICDKSFPSWDFDYEPEINYSNYVVTDREKDLNEQACDQARRILFGEEYINLLNLEKCVIALENQQVLTDISWSEFTESVSLSERVKSIDLSIISLKNTNTDAHILHESLMLQKELIGRWDKVIRCLPEKYLPQNAIQDNNKPINKELVLSSRQSETNQITGKKDVICFTEPVRVKDEVREVTKSNIEDLVVATINETSILANSDFILSMPETVKKEVEQEDTKQHECTKIGDVVADVPVRITEKPKKLKKVNKFDVSTNGNSQLVNVKSSFGERNSFMVWNPTWNPTGDTSHPGFTKPASDLAQDATKHKIVSEVNNELRKIGLNREKELSEKVKVAGQNSESVLSELCRESKETDIDVSISTGGNSFSEAEINESDSLLEYLNHKRVQFSKMSSKDQDNKKAKFHHSTQKEIKVFKQKVKVEYELIGPKNEGFSVESIRSNALTISDTRMEEVPSARSLKMDMQRVKMNKLKERAEQVNLENFSQFSKSKLIQEISLMDLQKLNVNKLKKIAELVNLKKFSKFPKSKLIQEISLKIIVEKNECNSSDVLV